MTLGSGAFVPPDFARSPVVAALLAVLAGAGCAFAPPATPADLAAQPNPSPVQAMPTEGVTAAGLPLTRPHPPTARPRPPAADRTKPPAPTPHQAPPHQSGPPQSGPPQTTPHQAAPPAAPARMTPSPPATTPTPTPSAVQEPPPAPPAGVPDQTTPVAVTAVPVRSRPAPFSPGRLALGPAPERLVGVEGAAVRRMLGPPSNVSDRPPAIVWTYDTAACQMALSFYMDVASRDFRVLTVDLTPKGAGGLTGRACVGAIRTAAR